MFSYLHLDINELRYLRDEFEKLDPGGQHGLTKAQFLKVVGVLNRKKQVGSSRKNTEQEEDDQGVDQMWDIIYDLFDVDKDESMSFKEFIFGFAVLSTGSNSDRLKFLFKMVDKDDNNFIDAQEVSVLVEILNNFIVKFMEQEESVIKLACTTDFIQEIEGSLACTQFEEIAKAHPAVTCWMDSLASSISGFIRELRSQKENEMLQIELMRMGSNSFGLFDGECLSIKPTRTDQEKYLEFKIDYETLEFDYEIGSGAFGSVWKADWLKMPVAVKKFHSQKLLDSLKDANSSLDHNGLDDGGQQELESQLSKQLNEIEVLANLRHPNILLFMGVCLNPVCIVTEFYSGGSLFSYLHFSETGHKDPSKMLSILTHVARGMAYLHSRKVLHRDLKSQNILVDYSLTHAVVCDFGLSSLKDSRKDGFEIPCGTVATMAPEIMEGRKYTMAADVYSFGIIMWETMTGRIPFEGYNPMQLMFFVFEGGRPEIKEEDAMPTRLVDLIKACWDTDIYKRPSFQDILEVLQYPAAFMQFNFMPGICRHPSPGDASNSLSAFSNRPSSLFDDRLSQYSLHDQDFKTTLLESYFSYELLKAICKNDLDDVKRLCSKGANVNFMDYEGRSPLTVAFSHKASSEIVEYLWEAGAEQSPFEKDTIS